MIFQKRTLLAFCTERDDFPTVSEIADLAKEGNLHAEELNRYIESFDLDPESIPVTVNSRQTPNFSVSILECGFGDEDDLGDFSEGQYRTPYHLITVDGKTIVPGVLLRTFSTAVAKAAKESGDLLQEDDEHLFIDLWQDLDDETKEKVLKKSLTAYDKSLSKQKLPKLSESVKEQIADMFNEIPSDLRDLGDSYELYPTLLKAAFPKLDDWSIHTITATVFDGIDEADTFGGDNIASSKGDDVMILDDDAVEAIHSAFDSDRRVTVAYQRLVHVEDDSVSLENILDGTNDYDFVDSVDESEVGTYVVYDSNFL